MLSIAICEDSVTVQSQLENYVYELFESCPVEVFSSGEELISALTDKSFTFSIYLMDISLPGISGIETAAAIRQNDPYALILYITDYKEYVYQVFETLPYRFILKPVQKDTFEKALSDAVNYCTDRRKTFHFHIDRVQYQIPLQEIIYFESHLRRITLYTPEKNYSFYGRLQDLPGRLNPLLFVRTHASYMVNMEYIRVIRETEIELQSGKIIPVSLILLPFYPKNLNKKILYEVCLFSSAAAYLLALNDITNMIPRFSNWVMTYIIIFHAGLWILFFLVLKLCRSADTNIPMSLWLIFLFIPVCTFASSLSLLFLIDGNYMMRPASDILHLVIQTTLLFINLTLLKFLQKFTGYFQKEKEQSLLSQQLQYQENYYQNLIDSFGQVKKIRHDIKNHLQTITLLYEESKTEELKNYLHRTTDLLQHSERVVSTGNPSFDSILNIKLTELHKTGILCSPILSIPCGLEFPFSDTVTVLGNLLDNAINACHQVLSLPEGTEGVPASASDSDPLSVILSVTWQQETLFLHMENPCSSIIKVPYGIGMKNVEEVVMKYSGTMNTEVKDGKYIIDIVLYSIGAESFR